MFPPITSPRRTTALVLLALVLLSALLSPLLVLLAQTHPAAASLPAAVAGDVTGAASPADRWAPLITAAMVQLGGILSQRKQLAAVARRLRALESAAAPLLTWWQFGRLPSVPAVPVSDVAPHPTRAGA